MSEYAPDPGRPLARILPTLLEAIARGALLVRVSDARILDANAAFVRLLARPPREVIGQSAIDLGLWADISALERLADELDHTMKPVVFELPDAIDAAAEVQAAAQLMSYEGERAIAFLTLDPTDHSAIQRSLYAAEERFERAFTEAPVGMTLIGVGRQNHGRYLRVNRAFCELTGYSEDEVVGRHFSDITHPEDYSDEDRDAESRMVSGDISSYETEKRYIRRDGSAVWARMHATLIRDANGTPLHGVSMAIDINDQKAAEAAQAERLRLEERLAQSQRLETVGQLAGGVAHDFNNLLAVILNYAYFVREQLPADSELRNDVEEIRQAAERASDLTHQLLVFSRDEAVKPEVLDLNAVVGEMERLLRRTIGDHVELSTELAPEACMVDVDRTQLEQVVMNLVVNARDAMPDGGTVSLSSQVVELPNGTHAAPDSLPPGRYAVLVVRDDGVGMEPDVAAHAFEPFFTTKPKGSGTGLGLATVYGTVTAAGGEADIESAPGEGTTVRVWLREASRARRDGRFASTDGAEPDRKTVLVVEDEDAVRRLTCRILEGGGFQCLSAASGPEALELADSREQQIDLLVTDVVMPGMSGKELAERLGGPSGPPVLFMSGYTDGSIPYRDQPEQEHTLLHKPFTAEALMRTVREVLQNSRAGAAR